MVDFVTVRSSLGPDEKLAADTDSGGIKRPVHHSEVETLLVEKVRNTTPTNYVVGGIIAPAAGSALYTFDLNALGLPRGALCVSARLMRNTVNNAGVRFRAHLFNAAPTFTDSDNALYAMKYADRAKRKGYVDFIATANEGAGSHDALEYIGALSNAQGIPLDPTDGVVRALLCARDAFTADAVAVGYGLELGFIL